MVQAHLQNLSDLEQLLVRNPEHFLFGNDFETEPLALL
jgi:hypothetical protein